MGINKKTISVSKTNLGLGNVQNLSPAEIAAILRSTRFSNYPSQLDEAEKSEWTEFINQLNKPSNLPESNKTEWRDFITGTIVETSQLPLGSIIMWASEKIPSGFVKCVGQFLYRDEGYGDIVDLLNSPSAPYTKLPDLSDRFPVGVGTKYYLNQVGGAERVTLTGPQSGIQEHKVYPVDSEGNPRYRTLNDEANSHWHAYLGDDALFPYMGNKTNNFRDFYDSLNPLNYSMKDGYHVQGSGNNRYVAKNRYCHPSGETVYNGNSYGYLKWLVSHGGSPDYSGDYRDKTTYAAFSQTSKIEGGGSFSGFYRTDGCSQHNHDIPEYTVNAKNATEPHPNIPPFCGVYFIMKVKLS